SDFCPRMDLLPNTSDHDGICGPRRSTAQRWGSDSRVGPKSQVRSGRPKGWIGPGRDTRLLDEHLSLNNLTKPCGRIVPSSASGMASMPYFAMVHAGLNLLWKLHILG